MKTEGIIGLLVIVASLAALVVVPFLTIWAINVLFGAGIAYSVQTWVATLVLGIFFRGVKING